ncbi:hypothetical protein C0583_01235 [Candidatus Parcubacteria bacterium]|nr:MAG: hypothetical protein C0583_01235 [Candidatus Parcubacteria bacterium]
MSKTNLLIDENEKTENNEVDDLDIQSDYQEENKNQDESQDGVYISKSKLAIVSSLLDNIKESQEKIVELMSGYVGPDNEAKISIGQMMPGSKTMASEMKEGESRVVEGVFDGENMIGPDGRQYSVPANYASKSKLVEGDILKLTITGKGTFVYKQIGPIERERVIGLLEQTENGNFIVKADDKEWRVITASVTYYKGKDGDEIIILVPKVGESKWAAVENIVRKTDK